jgi:hypothetical protein
VLWVAFNRAAMGMRVDAEKAIANMESILARSEAVGTFMFRPAQLGLLGVAHGLLGRHAEGLAHIGQGLLTARSTQGLEALPALYRLRAKTLVDLKQYDEAIWAAEEALSIATSQSARIEELRAAVMLVRMLEASPKRAEAVERLAGILATFEEGFGFPDLKAAARLLGTVRTQ